jgi:hypothetical protein
VLEMAKIIKNLRSSLNFVDNRPKTKENWLSFYVGVDDLIIKMKRSNLGKSIIESKLLDDWDYIKRFSEFAKNRHSGMVKAGHWKPFKRIMNDKIINI